MILPPRFFTLCNIPIDTEKISTTFIDKETSALFVCFENSKGMLFFPFETLSEARAADLTLRTHMNNLMLDRSGFTKTLSDLIEQNSSKGSTRH